METFTFTKFYMNFIGIYVFLLINTEKHLSKQKSLLCQIFIHLKTSQIISIKEKYQRLLRCKNDLKTIRNLKLEKNKSQHYISL